MKFLLLSDLHGYLPKIPTDRGIEAILISGDILPTYTTRFNDATQSSWMDGKLRAWINNLRDHNINIIACAGNHDWIFQRSRRLSPTLEWTYLEDSNIIYGGLNIWGSPWQLTFHNWAFNLDEDQLEEKYQYIHNDTTILISHGPPYGAGDQIAGKITHLGSVSLTERIRDLNNNLRLVVTGHIHSGNGIYQIDNTTIVNASIMDENYVPTNPSYIYDSDTHNIEVVYL